METSPRGLIKIRREEGFWGIYIPKTDEFLVSKRMGDIKKVLFEHFEVEKMSRPDVEIITAEVDDQYKEKVKSLRKQVNSTLELKGGEKVEILEVVKRFSLQEIHVRDIANFLLITQKRVRELVKGEE